MKASRLFLSAAAIAILAACNRQTDNMFTQPFPLEPDMNHALVTKWAQKDVLDTKLIEDMEGLRKWEVKMGPADISYTDERSMDGGQSLRYHVSLLDTAHINSMRSPWGSFSGSQGGEACVSLAFDEPQDWSAYNRLSLWVYIHPSANPHVNLAFDLVDAVNPEETLTPGREMNVVLKQGCWQNVLWEIDYMKRDSIVRFELWHTLTGYDRQMGEQYVTVDFDRLELQRVEVDHYSGWDIPAGQFAYSHIGYQPDDNKVAITRPGDDTHFTLTDEKGREVFRGEQQLQTVKGNSFAVLDFSAFRGEGMYSICYGDARTEPFPISADVWLNPMFAALNFYYCQRCGYEVPGIHSVCHQDCRGFYEDEERVMNGGWHDAGDLSQGFWRTADGCLALMKCVQALGTLPVKQATLRNRLAEEAAWGVDWLLKTRFHDGRHISWITQRIYSDNQQGTADDVVVPATHVAWETLQGIAVFLMAADVLPEWVSSMDGRQKKLEQAAVTDWEQVWPTLRSSESVSLLEAAWGAIASSQLYRHFGKEEYKEAAMMFGSCLLTCQEQQPIEGTDITGFFYTDTRRQTLQHYFHEAFEEVPVMAFATLCHTFPGAGEKEQWLNAVSLYSNHFLKPGCELSAPYHLVPNGVYRRADMGQPSATEAPNYSLLQYEAGTQLNDEYAMRTFPIWQNYSFHGSTNCQLSASWALAEASALLNDSEGMALVQQQLEWVMGRNPFGQSLMYGVGYNYCPQFVYCTQNIVGALPVGIDSYQHDEPFWHSSAYATFKEIWIEPVSRFLATLAEYITVTTKTTEPTGNK